MKKKERKRKRPVPPEIERRNINPEDINIVITFVHAKTGKQIPMTAKEFSSIVRELKKKRRSQGTISLHETGTQLR